MGLVKIEDVPLDERMAACYNNATHRALETMS